MNKTCERNTHALLSARTSVLPAMVAKVARASLTEGAAEATAAAAAFAAASAAAVHEARAGEENVEVHEATAGDDMRLPVPSEAAVATVPETAAGEPKPPAPPALAGSMAAAASATGAAASTPEAAPPTPSAVPRESLAGSAKALATRAAALRLKFRRGADLQRIHPLHLGFHPANRGGQPPSVQRCSQLLRTILKDGYSSHLADFDGVVVEEAPGSVNFFKFNEEATAGDESLAPVLTGTLAFATLSHSHLNQILRNVMMQCVSDVTEICTADGKLAVQRLAAVDCQFAKACHEGLLWEVLDYHIMEEEPEGCYVIQAACNAPNGVAMIAHEMETISALCRICKRSASLGAKDAMRFEAVQSQLALVLPQAAQDPDLVQLLRFVVDMGGEDANWIKDLRDFHTKFVDPKVGGN